MTRRALEMLSLPERLLAVASELNPTSVQAVALEGIVRDLEAVVAVPEPRSPVWLVVHARRAVLRERGDALAEMGVTDAIYWESILEDFRFARDIARALVEQARA